MARMPQSAGGSRPTGAWILMILLLVAMVHGGDIHHHKSPKNNPDLDGVQGHSRDPKASDAENRLMAPPRTSASLF